MACQVGGLRLAGELRVVLSLESVHLDGNWAVDFGHRVLHIKDFSLNVWICMLLESYESVYVEFCMDIQPFKACWGEGGWYIYGPS